MKDDPVAKLSQRDKRQLYAECYGMGDVKVALITGRYPNESVFKKERKQR
jgi:hypothetical protein